MIGSGEPRPSIRRSIVVGQREGAVQHDAGERRERAGRVGEQRGEQHLGAVGRDDDERALGEARQHVDHRHPGDDDAEHLAGQQLGVALDEPPFDRAHDAADRRRDEEPVLGQRPHRHRPSAPRPAASRDDRRDRGDDLVELVGVGAVGDDGEQAGAPVRELGERERRRSGPSRRACAAMVEPELLRPGPARRGRRARAARERRGWRRSARCSASSAGLPTSV